jgi:quinol monooxygenase YgiN
MFIISGLMHFDPSRREEVSAACAAAAAASQSDEGCLTYGFSEDVNQPGAFRIFEHWASEDAFAKHCQAPHYLTFMEFVGKVGMTGADVNRYEVSSSQSLTGG